MFDPAEHLNFDLCRSNSALAMNTRWCFRCAVVKAPRRHTLVRLFVV